MIICSELFSTRSIYLRWGDMRGEAPIIITEATTDTAILNDCRGARIAAQSREDLSELVR
jgi:hypothetical protein